MGELLDVVLKALSALLSARLEVLSAARALVAAMEVSDECSSEIGPIVYGARRQVLKPSPRLFRKMGGKELDDQMVVLDPRHATHESVVFQPHARICGAIVHGDVDWRAYLWGKLFLSDFMPKGAMSHPRWARVVLVPSFAWLIDIFLFQRLL